MLWALNGWPPARSACLLVRLMRPAAAVSTTASRKHLRPRQSCAKLRPEMSVLVCLSPVWPVEGQQPTGVWQKRGWRDLSPRAPALAACAVQREPLSPSAAFAPCCGSARLPPPPCDLSSLETGVLLGVGLDKSPAWTPTPTQPCPSPWANPGSPVSP